MKTYNQLFTGLIATSLCLAAPNMYSQFYPNGTDLSSYTTSGGTNFDRAGIKTLNPEQELHLFHDFDEDNPGDLFEDYSAGIRFEWEGYGLTYDYDIALDGNGLKVYVPALSAINNPFPLNIDVSGNVGIGNPSGGSNPARLSVEDQNGYSAQFLTTGSLGRGIKVTGGIGVDASSEYQLIKLSRYSSSDGILDIFQVDGKSGITRAREIIVDLNTWPDYVFEKNYDLMNISSLNKYIEEHGHLPDVPSAKEVTESGVNLGQMDAILLRKIEELTLHIIEQDRRLAELENK